MEHFFIFIFSKAQQFSIYLPVTIAVKHAYYCEQIVIGIILLQTRCGNEKLLSCTTWSWKLNLITLLAINVLLSYFNVTVYIIGR